MDEKEAGRSTTGIVRRLAVSDELTAEVSSGGREWRMHVMD